MLLEAILIEIGLIFSAIIISSEIRQLRIAVERSSKTSQE
jgi:hypothetical protein